MVSSLNPQLKQSERSSFWVSREVGLSRSYLLNGCRQMFFGFTTQTGAFIDFTISYKIQMIKQQSFSIDNKINLSFFSLFLPSLTKICGLGFISREKFEFQQIKSQCCQFLLKKMGGCQTKQTTKSKKSRNTRNSRKMERSKQEESKVVEQKVQEPVVMDVPEVEEEKSLTEVEKIYKKYGEHGIQVILAKQNSKYQSQILVRITQRCDQFVNDLEQEGHKVIDEHKALSQNDFKQVVTSLEEQDAEGVKKTQARTRKTIKQLLQFDEQIAKYEDSRTTMKEKFEDEKSQLKQAIKKETREHEKIDIYESIPEFDNQPRSIKEQMIEEAEEKYGKKWAEDEDKNKKSHSYQFDFSHNHRPKFEALIPRQECQEKRKEIKEYFEASGKDWMASNAICC